MRIVTMEIKRMGSYDHGRFCEGVCSEISISNLHCSVHWHISKCTRTRKKHPSKKQICHGGWSYFATAAKAARPWKCKTNDANTE